MDPRQDREADIVDDEVPVALSLLCRPTDHLIPGFGLPGDCTGAQNSDDFSGGAHEVAQLCAGHELMPEVMMAFDAGVLQDRVHFGEHETDAGCNELDGREVHRLTDRLFDARIGPIGDRFRISRRPQADQPIYRHYPEHAAEGRIRSPADLDGSGTQGGTARLAEIMTGMVFRDGVAVEKEGPSENLRPIIRYTTFDYCCLHRAQPHIPRAGKRLLCNQARHESFTQKALTHDPN